MDITDTTPEAEYEVPPNGHPEEPTWQAIFSAPNYGDLIKTRTTARAREYRDKTNSLLKAGLVGSMNAGDFPDAAAILRYGPAFSNATGQLADTSDRAAAIIDMITSPANPVAMFALAAIPLVAQVVRNHEKQIEQVPAARAQARRQKKAMKAARKEEEPRFTIRLLKWRLPVHWHPKKIDVRKVFAGFRSQTLEPEALANDVFTDPDVLKALERMGVLIRVNRDKS